MINSRTGQSLARGKRPWLECLDEPGSEVGEEFFPRESQGAPEGVSPDLLRDFYINFHLSVERSAINHRRHRGSTENLNLKSSVPSPCPLCLRWLTSPHSTLKGRQEARCGTAATASCRRAAWP